MSNEGASDTRHPRVLLIHTHPVQYLVPLFREYATSSLVDLTVSYCWVPDSHGHADPEFGVATDWGIELLGGYDFVDLSSRRGGHRLREFNPSVWRLVRDGNFDVVIAYGYNFPTSIISLIAAKRYGAKWGFVGDNHTLASRSGRPRPGKRSFLRLLGRVSDVVVAQSARSVAFYRQFAGEKVRLVPHAVDDRRFRQMAETPSDVVPTRRARTVFLFVGKLVADKRVSDLLEALALVPDAECWIAGSGSEEGQLKQQAARLGVSVRFLGFVSQLDLPAIYAAADVLVLPSRSETFGLCVSEAAAVDLPAIVSSACGVVDSLVIDGMTGLVFEAGNVAALAIAMRQVADYEMRGRLRDQLRTIQSGWTISANAHAFLKLCDDLVDTTSAGG